MQNKEGLFVVIEGADGAGKSTQFKLLIERLGLAGYDVATFDFPRYEEPSSYFVKQYLNGVYGDVNDIGPYTASLFYALDRYEAAEQIRTALAAGKVVLADRFTGSSMAHQGTKFRHADECRGYFIWLDNLEFEMLRIPRPDINLVLRVPADIAQESFDKREKRSYTDRKRDIHEADIDHLRRAVEVYDDLCQLFPRDFVRIDCVRSGKLLPIETVSNLAWEKVFPFLPKPSHPRKAVKAEVATAGASVTGNPYIEKSDNGITITDMDKSYLSEIVTDTTGTVYGFTGAVDPAMVAAAMVRLSRNTGDIRSTLLDEFAHNLGKDEKFLREVITTSDNASLQQLTSLHMVVEGASSLLTKKLEWGRLAAYLEQPTSYIHFDQKDADGQYKYFVPEQLDDVTKVQYRAHMDQIFDRYSRIVHRLLRHVRESSSTQEPERDVTRPSAAQIQVSDAAQYVLPVATTSAVGIFASVQAIESLIMHLQSDELPEARSIGDQMLVQARKIVPALLEYIDKPAHGGAWLAYRASTAAANKKLAAQYLSGHHADPSQKPVDLVDAWPRNELQLVPDMLYESSNLPLRELQAIVEAWPYDKKAAVIATYIGERLSRHHRPGRAIEKAHYSWDIVCDYGTFRELQRHRMVDDLEWQALTPRYGFEIPELIEDAGLSDMFEECFDISLKLYSLLQQAGYMIEAQYATLLGHKMRWKVTYNAREAFHLHEISTSPQANPVTRKLVKQMHEKLAEVHPILAAAMRFVDKSEGTGQ